MMKMYFVFDDDGAVRASSPAPDLVDCVEVDVPDDFDPLNQDLYVYKNGKLEYREERKAIRIREEQREKRRSRAMERLLEKQAVEMVKELEAGTDIEDIFDFTPLLPIWTPRGYMVGDIVQYEDEPYRCIVTHDAAANPSWTPLTATLWVPYRQAVEEWPEWVQPLGGHDAYMKGDKVTHMGEKYTSLIDGNVWAPTAYPAGWKQE